MKIYIACGLTHVPRTEFHSYVRFLHSLAGYLMSQLGAEVKYALRDSDPQLATRPFADRARLCYLWDRQMVEWADIVLAEASFPSIGLGIELQIAEAKDTPIVLTFRSARSHKAEPVQYENPDSGTHDLQLGDGYVSLMALGLPSVFKLVPYTSPEEVIPRLADAIAEVKRR